MICWGGSCYCEIVPKNILIDNYDAITGRKRVLDEVLKEFWIKTVLLRGIVAYGGLC